MFESTDQQLKNCRRVNMLKKDLRFGKLFMLHFVIVYLCSVC